MNFIIQRKLKRSVDSKTKKRVYAEYMQFQFDVKRKCH